MKPTLRHKAADMYFIVRRGGHSSDGHRSDLFPWLLDAGVEISQNFRGGSRSSQARSQDFVQEGANRARAQGTPTKNRNLLGFDALFFGSGPIHFFFSFLYFFRSGVGWEVGEMVPCLPPPLSTSPSSVNHARVRCGGEPRSGSVLQRTTDVAIGHHPKLRLL